MTAREKDHLTLAERERRGLDMVRALNRGADQPTLENLRQEARSGWPRARIDDPETGR